MGIIDIVNMANQLAQTKLDRKASRQRDRQLALDEVTSNWNIGTNIANAVAGIAGGVNQGIKGWIDSENEEKYNKNRIELDTRKADAEERARQQSLKENRTYNINNLSNQLLREIGTDADVANLSGMDAKNLQNALDNIQKLVGEWTTQLTNDNTDSEYNRIYNELQGYIPISQKYQQGKEDYYKGKTIEEANKADNMASERRIKEDSAKAENELTRMFIQQIPELKMYVNGKISGWKYTGDQQQEEKINEMTNGTEKQIKMSEELNKYSWTNPDTNGIYYGIDALEQYKAFNSVNLYLEKERLEFNKNIQRGDDFNANDSNSYMEAIKIVKDDYDRIYSEIVTQFSPDASGNISANDAGIIAKLAKSKINDAVKNGAYKAFVPAQYTGDFSKYIENTYPKPDKVKTINAKGPVYGFPVPTTFEDYVKGYKAGILKEYVDSYNFVPRTKQPDEMYELDFEMGSSYP